MLTSHDERVICKKEKKNYIGIIDDFFVKKYKFCFYFEANLKCNFFWVNLYIKYYFYAKTQ